MGTEIKKCRTNSPERPQCQYFVVRKKRLCQMTVRVGRNYCGEHEPKTEEQDDTRIPCPYDSKHTCFASKLQKHLTICNARRVLQPPYIVHNINAAPPADHSPRRLLSQLPLHKILALIDKVNILYHKYVEDNISEVSEQPIHAAVLEDFNTPGRTESSLRHLRQASSLLHLIEAEGLVQDNTCYVELGAGKGHLSYYAHTAWCGDDRSTVLLVDRASLRHKRDNKLRESGASSRASGAGEGAGQGGGGAWGGERATRLRADLAHLALGEVPTVAQSSAVIGFAKHLCGVATDYALRCITTESVIDKVRGVVLATCCHHRCERPTYVGNEYLQEIGIDEEDLNIMLGIVSWATCGDGRSRERRAAGPQPRDHTPHARNNATLHNSMDDRHTSNGEVDDDGNVSTTRSGDEELGTKGLQLSRAEREAAGRSAKALLEWGRARFLRARGFRACLHHYVPSHVSLENLCIVATKLERTA